MYDEKNNTDSNLRPLRWLHISDIHLGDSDWDVWMSTANAFLNSISQQVSEHQFTPDVIFITGDLTLSATPEQFDKFKLFIDQIYDAIGTTLPVITVPGNHDLSRPDMEKTTNFKFNQLKEYSNQEDTEEVSCIKRELWEEANAEYIEPLFTSYQSFFNAHIKPTLNLPGITFKPSFFPGDIKVELALKGCVPVTIIGLNSSWLQYNGDNYQGKLCVHPKQFTHLFNSTELKDFDQCHSLLLMHHPVSWLHEPAQQEFEKSIYQPNSFNACFHGHMHETRTVHVSNGNGNRHYFQSPSLLGIEGYGSKHEERQIGYTLGELNSDGDIIVWPYKQAKRDNFFHFDNSVVENTNEQTGIEIRFAKDLEKQKVNAHNSASRTDEKQEESPKPEAKEDVNKQTEPNDEKQQSQTKDTSNENPYKFLKFFDVDEPLYGRGVEVAKVVGQVKQLLNDDNVPCFFGLKGVSGSGKSSLLRAGILTKLKNDGYFTVTFRPTDFHSPKGEPENIISHIVEKISKIAGINLSPSHLADLLISHTQQAKKLVNLLIDAINSIEKSTIKKLVIGLDQLEEILDDLANETTQHLWADLVSFIDHAVNSHLIGFVYTLESSRQQIIEHTQVSSLMDMTAEQELHLDGYSKVFWEAIITEPFMDAGFKLDRKEIVNKLLDNIAQHTVNTNGNSLDSLLPLLALTLSHLFHDIKESSNNNRHKKTRKYDLSSSLNQVEHDTIKLEDIINPSLLDINEVIKAEAEAAWADLEDDSLDHFLAPLIKVTDPTTDSFVLRQISTFSYIDEQKTAKQFIQHRLLIEEDGKIRLVHEAVITAWPKAQMWYEKRKVFLLIIRGFREDADTWNKKESKIIDNPTKEDINYAADILHFYLRLWSLSTQEQLIQEDQLLKDYCLAIFANSTTPKSVLNSSPNQKCHIHLAANYNQVQLLEKFYLLDSNSINYPSNDGRVPLSYAAWHSLEAVSYLLKCKADPLQRNNKGQSVLGSPIVMGNRQIFDQLIEYFSTEQLTNWGGGYCAFHAFCYTSVKQSQWQNHLYMAKYLADLTDLNPNHKDDFGYSPILLLALSGYSKLFKFFVGLSNVNAQNNDGWTALHLAAQNGHIEIVQRLLELPEFEPSVNIRTNSGFHALHIATDHKHPEIVQLLLDYDVDCNVQVSSDSTFFSGMTGLHLALYRLSVIRTSQYQDKDFYRK